MIIELADLQKIEKSLYNSFKEIENIMVTYVDGYTFTTIELNATIYEKHVSKILMIDKCILDLNKEHELNMIILKFNEEIEEYLIENNIRQADSINITLFNLDLENVNPFKQLDKFKEEVGEFEFAMLGDNDLEIAKEFLDVCQSAYSLLRKLNIPPEVLKLAQEQHNEKMKNRPR